MENKEKQVVDMEAGNIEDVLEYANVFVVSHSSDEFLIDFAVMLPGQTKPRILSRIVLTPKNAKILYRLMEQNIKDYESKFGTIAVAPEGIETKSGGVS